MTAQALAGVLAGITLALAIVGVALFVSGRRQRLAAAEELARRALSDLAGKTIVVNTPKPDDQSIEGVVVEELPTGVLVLAGATYLSRERDRGREIVRRVPAGDVHVPGPRLGSWIQLLHPTPGQEA